MTDAITVLIVDDMEDARWALSTFVRKVGFVPLQAETGRDALATLSTQRVDAVLLDVRMPDLSGHEVLEQIRKQHDTPVIMLTGYGDTQDAAASLRRGANDYVTKPYDHQLLERSLRRVLAKPVPWLEPESRSVPRVLMQPEEAETLACLIESMGVGTKAQRVIHAVKHVAPTDLTVLLHGETGTGKELVSRAIHDLSSQRAGPFIVLDCGAIPESLIESELFGHKKGAFTGAVESHPGVFDLAQGGTLFLDEISSLPLLMQTRLMRVVEAREFRRIGGTHTRRLTARIIAASNVSLVQMIQKKEFRSDFYYRLNEYPVVLPPLRERKEDIPDLVRHFLDIERREHRTSVTGISEEGLDLLQHQDWPGNVRELRNAIRHALVLNMDQNGMVTADAISQHFGLSPNTSGYPRDLGPTPTPQTSRSLCDASCPLHLNAFPQGPDGQVPFKDIIDAVRHSAERQILSRMLEQTNNNKALAARLLQIDYKTLCSKLKFHKILGKRDAPV
ncbi:sigma-54-dependent transcriptional regulator [Marinobacter gelidimuriae]|uniref:sigma-54-dependent transcriptional regulator n=1 Tax=Marinobacter gelidimuriae TaxID=2739064 RepID=UPI00038123B5|nr:sigma-54 dependent transcriptional regulator [Marinobacter gelidimuriae]